MGKLMERKLKDYAVLMLKGMGMGAADVVPGVSGGTIAFIVGIYGCQHLFASFFRFFRADSNPLHLLGFFRQSLLSFIMYYIRGHSIDNGLYYPAESTTSFVQIVKRFRLKFCSGNFPLFLAKATKHKM